MTPFCQWDLTVSLSLAYPHQLLNLYSVSAWARLGLIGSEEGGAHTPMA